MESRNDSPWQRPFAPKSCDVAVVGGGAIGAATVFALREIAPEADVVLVEAGTLASGASGRNAGFLIPGTHTDPASAIDAYGEDVARRVFRFTLESVERARALNHDAFDLRLTGNLIAAGSDGEAEQLRRSAELLENEGLPCTYLDSSEVRDRTGGGRFAGGLHVAAGGTLDPVRLVRHLVSESGAAVFERWPVTEFEAVTDGIRLGGPEGILTAKTVILCLNAFLPHLEASTSRFVRPVRAQMLATAPVLPFLDLPVYSHEGYFYVRQTAAGRVLLGGARHLHEADEVGYDTAPTSAVQNDIEAYIREHFPQVGEVAVERRWAGTMGFSPDGLPVAGALENSPGVIFACGFTGHGMSYSLRFGLLLARIARGIPDEAADIFSPHRFERKHDAHPGGR